MVNNLVGGWHVIPFDVNVLSIHCEQPINNWISSIDAASVKFSTCNLSSSPV